MSVWFSRLSGAAVAVFALLFTAVTSHGQPSDIDAALADYQAGNYNSAFRTAQRLAPEGHIVAQTMLGLMYQRGQGTDQNLAAADEWLSRAAEQGYVFAMTSLADLHFDHFYSLDDGRLKNRPLAVEWYHRAAEAGNSYAQRRLGLALITGQGVDQDRATGLSWMERSVEAGNRFSMYRLGYMYESGELDLQDIHKALELYRITVTVYKTPTSPDWELGTQRPVTQPLVTGIYSQCASGSVALSLSPSGRVCGVMELSILPDRYNDIDPD